MSLNESLSTWWAGRSRRLSETSIILQTFKYDDRVQALRSRPLGMFLYNQRALFLGASALFLLALSLMVWWMGPNSNSKIVWGLVALAGCWVLDSGVTVARHGSFARKLNAWASSASVHSDFPPLFDTYFLLDSAVIVLLIVLSLLLGLKLEAFAFLLFANTVVYSAYSRQGRSGRRFINVCFYAQLLLTLCLLPFTKITAEEPQWFFTLLYVAPLLGMFSVTVWSVLMISWLRSREHSITQRRLMLLGQIESTLSERIADAGADQQPQRRRKQPGQPELHPRVQFDRQVREVLKSLCTLGPPFWYTSAVLWLVERHQDRDEPLLLPGPSYNLAGADGYAGGVPSSTGFFGRSEITLLHSVKYQAAEEAAATPGLERQTDAPAAFIPLLSREDERVGVLAFYGREGGGVPQRGESTFLASLATIISNSMEQWEGRYWSAARAEMDDLFDYEQLASLWDPAADLIKKYLMAGGCMIIYRPDPAGREMRVIAEKGFSEEILEHNLYEVGKGQTGECAQLGKPIRYDDVERHKEKFDQSLLQGMEDAHGSPIRSWMSIPIGPAHRNYGVIKVVNSTFMSHWFNAEDEKLGKAMALRLQVIIEKFLHIDEVVRARDRAETQSEEARRQSEKATRLQKEAEETARQRQQDLMIITHQLQGPLASLTGAVSFLQLRPLAKDVQDSLEYIKDLIEDGIALCYGTFTSFALELKRANSFGTHDIDAPRELQKLARRLQKTNARDDLTFSFYHAPGFPVVRMDREVFTSVLYSLIHNAMKYADPHTQVSLVCAFERGQPALKVKSVGEPIHQSESELIFQRFKRGRTVEKTGRHHGGVGLGLWVARELMRAVKGDLTVDLPPGEPRLSVFVVFLP